MENKTIYTVSNHSAIAYVITVPPNGPVLFRWLNVCRRMWSVVIVCNAAGVRAGRPPGAWTVGAPAAGARGRLGGRNCTAGQYGYVQLRRHLVLRAITRVIGEERFSATWGSESLELIEF